jgi:hypothetical protein
MLRRMVVAQIIFILAFSAAVAARPLAYRITQLTSDPMNHFNPQINDLGQVGWCMAQGRIYESFFTITGGKKLSQASCIAGAGGNFQDLVWTGNVGGFSQVFSSRQGQVTKDAADHFDPVVNDKGEIAWIQFVGRHAQVFSNRQGQVTKGAVDHYQPALNGLGEIVWVQSDDTRMQVFSNRRGQITFTRRDHQQPALNDPGELVWIEKIGSWWQVVSSANGPITVAPANHYFPRINNLGTTVWSQQVGSYYQIFQGIPELW